MDIVDKLRRHAVAPSAARSQIEIEAADEIERLRKRVDELLAYNNEQVERRRHVAQKAAALAAAVSPFYRAGTRGMIAHMGVSDAKSMKQWKMVSDLSSLPGCIAASIAEMFVSWSDWERLTETYADVTMAENGPAVADERK